MDTIANKGLRTEKFYMPSDDGNNVLLWDVFGGRIQITLLPSRKGGGGQSGEDMRNALKKRLDRDVLTVLDKGLEKMKDAKPGTTYPIVIFRWDPQERKQKRDYVINIGRGEDRVHYIEVDMGKGKQSFRFGKVRHISLGTDPLQDAEQSSIRIQSFINWLRSIVPFEMVLTSTPMPQQGGQRGGGGGNSAAAPSNDGGGREAKDGWDNQF